MEPDIGLSALRPDITPPSLEAARGVARIAQKLGGRAWFVGGCVRDALLGRPCHDFDVEVHDVAPDRLFRAISEKWRLDEVGASFGVVKLKHLDVDVSLPRRETRLGAGHRDFAVDAEPGLSPAEAAARRDFTLNAIMADPLSLELLDPHNGVGDLRRGILRHVSPHFSEDPLRVLRGMQFLARFPFLSAAPETIALCSGMSQDSLPRERLAGEWEKMLLSSVRPSHGLEFLRDCGWLRFYPELAALRDCPQEPAFHPEGDVWAHTLLALDASVALRTGNHDDDLALSLAALCHDFGKPEVTATGDDGRIHAYEHEVRGEKHARSFVNRLWNMSKLVDMVAKLVVSHMRPVPLVLDGAGDRAWRRLSVEVGRLDLLAGVVECDIRATTPPGSDPDNHPSLGIVRKFREKIASLAIAQQAPRPLMLGRHLIARGLKPGPDFGPILEACYEAQLSGEITDEATGNKFLDEFLSRGDSQDKSPR